ncbi:MAG: sensor histidine kinase, partial [Sideroxydans sp.]
GTRMPGYFSLYPLPESVGKGVAAVVTDLTEVNAAAEEIRKLNAGLEQRVAERTAKLEAANKELESFAYSVSHDLRVPLRAVDGFSRMLLKRYEDKLDDEGKRQLNIVRDNAQRMSRLIDDILAYSRMGRLDMSMTQIDMDALAREVFDELKSSLAGRELSVEINALPPCQGDLAKLREVWANLLSNAIKFTRNRTPALVEVAGHTQGDEVIYYVKDNGAGFDMQFADKLFGVFQRLHRIEDFDGTGIGLAIVKRIVIRHGGRVWAEGKLDEGATFYFALPNQGRKT